MSQSPEKSPVRLFQYLTLDWEENIVPMTVMSGCAGYEEGAYYAQEVWVVGEVTELGHVLEGPAKRFEITIRELPSSPSHES